MDTRSGSSPRKHVKQTAVRDQGNTPIIETHHAPVQRITHAPGTSAPARTPRLTRSQRRAIEIVESGNYDPQRDGEIADEDEDDAEEDEAEDDFTDEEDYRDDADYVEDDEDDADAEDDFEEVEDDGDDIPPTPRAGLPRGRVVQHNPADDEMPAPPTAMPIRYSGQLDLGKVDPTYRGWLIVVRLDVSLALLEAVGKLSEASRTAKRLAENTNGAVKAQVSAMAVRTVLKDLIYRWNFVDEKGHPLPQPPLGLNALRGDLLAATLNRATMAVMPSKKSPRGSTKRSSRR